jgi:hypothetical protein
MQPAPGEHRTGHGNCAEGEAMKPRIAVRVLGFALGLGFPLAIGFSAPPSPAQSAASPILLVQAGGATEAEAQEVFDRCKHSGLTYTNCDCMVAEYRAARAAAPSPYEALKMYDRTRTKCFDRELLEEHYTKMACVPHNQHAELMLKSGAKSNLADCSCFARRMADLIMSGKRPAGREMADALLGCPAR